MKRHKFCKATKVIHGDVLRCQLPRGHFSAHFAEHHWWANEKGLPVKRQHDIAVILWWGIGLAILLIAVAVWIGWP